MANIKITALPANTSVTPGSDVLPLVSAGVTTKATPSQIVNATLLAPGPIGSTTPGSANFTTLNVANTISGAGFSNYLASPPPIGSSSANSGRFTTLTVNGSTTLNVGLNGLLLSTSGVVSAATAGVNYAPATSGTSILYGNGSGGFSGVTIGSGLTFSSGTLSATGGGGGSGTVTSVGLSLPNIFNVTNSPVTTTGTLTGALATQTANYVFAGPATGSAAVPTFRSLVASDIPALSYAPATTGSSILYANGSGGFSSVTVGSGLTFSAGTLASTASGGTVTSVSVVSANGLAGTVANASSTPAITLSTSITGLLKGNGTAISAATAGTDYAAATTGTNTQLLANNGSGGFSNVTVGSGLTLTSGTLAATSGGGGTVTNCSVVSANGFGGSVATSTTTPAITLTTSITGLLKGNGTAVSAAVSGTDYAPATSGSSILYGNGSGGFSNVTIGSNLTFASGTLSATGGGGMTYPGAGIPNSTGSAWGTSYGTSGATSVVLRDANVNISTNNIFVGYTVLASSGTTTTLTAASVFDWSVTGSSGQTFQLPNATTLPVGAFYTFNNNQSSGVITLNNNSGSSLISGGVGSGGYVELILQDNSSAAGTWDYHFQIPANVSWTTNTLNYPGSFTGGTWNGSTVAVNRGGTGATTLTGIVKGNGTSAFTAATSGTDYSAGTSALTTGLLKSTTTTGALSIAVAGTDYAAATTGTSAQLLANNGSGGFSNVTVGSGLSLTTGTLTAPSSMTYPGAGIANSTGSAWGTSYTTSGSGTVVALATSPSFTTPTLGVASATTVNKVTLTAPATGSTLTIADGKTLTASNTLTFTGTDASSVAFGTGGTVIYSGGALGTPSSGTLTSCTGLPISTGVSGLGTNVATFLATPSSANLASALTDETGSGSAVFATSPTLVTPTLGVASATSVNKVTLTAPATGSTLTIADGKTLTASNSITLAGTDSTTMTFPPASTSVGYLNIPQNAQTSAYTLVLADSGKHIYMAAAQAATTMTIPANGTVAFPIGTAVTFVNMSVNAMTIAITTDTMYLGGTGTTGSRTLAQYGTATALKMTSTTWIISGSGLT